jgi:hypothetical protein
MKVLVGGRAEEILGTIFGVSGDKPRTLRTDCEGCPPTGVSTEAGSVHIHHSRGVSTDGVSGIETLGF